MAKGGPLKLRRESKGTHLEGRKREGKTRVCSGGRVCWVLRLEGFYLEVSGEDLNRIFISFADVFPQGPGLY